MTASGIQTIAELMRQAALAARTGDRGHARGLLKRVLDQDPANEQALLWSAAVADSMDVALQHLHRLLEVNPNHQQAARILSVYQTRKREPAASSTMETGPPSAQASLPPRPSQKEFPRATDDGAASEAESLTTNMGRTKPARARWRCPFCATAAPERQERCPRCRAVPHLQDLRAITMNEGADESLLQTAVREWQKRAANSQTAESCSMLALALLNLRRSAEALPWVRKACELDPGDGTLRIAAHLLEVRKLVLAVDDSATVRRIISLILDQAGYRILTAADGMEALAKLSDFSPDLVLLDITMPRMDGYQVCKVIKQNGYTRRIPVLMLSGKDGVFNKIRGKLAGAADYLTKPLEEDSLLRSVEKQLREARPRLVSA